ncbi:hypothetical protein FGB62_74g01 [Gracilaria domingensis]|nr:hypothetical protein FGB62_74g01 [Gracilaria domingensis]
MAGTSPNENLLGFLKAEIHITASGKGCTDIDRIAESPGALCENNQQAAHDCFIHSGDFAVSPQRCRTSAAEACSHFLVTAKDVFPKLGGQICMKFSPISSYEDSQVEELRSMQIDWNDDCQSARAELERLGKDESLPNALRAEGLHIELIEIISFRESIPLDLYAEMKKLYAIAGSLGQLLSDSLQKGVVLRPAERGLTFFPRFMGNTRYEERTRLDQQSFGPKGYSGKPVEEQEKPEMAMQAQNSDEQSAIGREMNISGGNGNGATLEGDESPIECVEEQYRGSGMCNISVELEQPIATNIQKGPTTREQKEDMSQSSDDCYKTPPVLLCLRRPKEEAEKVNP